MPPVLIVIIYLSVYVAISVVASKLVCKALDKNPYRTTLLLFSFLITFILLPAYIVGYRKFAKKRDNEYKSVISGLETAPNESLIDRYIAYGEKYGIEQTWDKLRGVWVIVNECPKITTDKKLEFRNYLMARGLRLLGNDKNIIDNFSK